MSGAIIFDRETSLRMAAVYQTRDVIRRRQRVKEALQLQDGEHVIDIGTGPGFVAAEMAEAVGSGGRVHGIDSSEAMLQLAAERCAPYPWVSFQAGSATALPVADASFDVAVSVQVFEYIPDVDTALRETFRVLKPGGRALIAATDWESMSWHSEDPARMRRVLHAFEAHCAFSNLPRTLAPRLRRAGFAQPRSIVLPQFNPSLDPDTYSFHQIELVKSFVPGRAGVTCAEAAAWSEELHRLGASEQYFFCVNQYLFLAAKPGEAHG
jgi:arsenite methyltransferase